MASKKQFEVGCTYEGDNGYIVVTKRSAKLLTATYRMHRYFAGKKTLRIEAYPSGDEFVWLPFDGEKILFAASRCITW